MELNEKDFTSKTIAIEELSHISEMTQEKLSAMEGVPNNSTAATNLQRRAVEKDEFLELKADTRSTLLDFKEVAVVPPVVDPLGNQPGAKVVSVTELLRMDLNVP